MNAENFLDRMAERLRRWRSQTGLTLQQLAERSDVAASTIHKIEVRKTIPTVSVLFKIAQGLDRPVTEFMEDDPEPAARLQRRQEPAIEVENGVLATAIGDPDRDARGWRLQLAAERGTTPIQAEGDLMVVCEEGALEVSRGSTQWRLEPGDVLSLRAPAPFRLDLRADGTSRLLLFGQVPNTARALLDREAQRTRASAALVHSA